jgi:putative spermidine/putrescine transport system ATP-binding protein
MRELVLQSISLRGICKGYGGAAPALDDVTLNVRSGEFLTLLGPSGSGKTTLLMVVAGFTRPDGGSLKVGDVETIGLPPHRRNIGVVFQNYALFPHMNVQENVAYPLRLRKTPRDERDRKVCEALALVQLEALAARKVDELSGGQKQRVALARAIVFSPQLLLMDEPLSALDKNLRAQMQIELKRLHRSLGMTTICVTHDQGEAVTMSDRVAVMNRGRIVQVGTPRDIYERPVDRFVAGFVGESSLVPVMIRGGIVQLADCPLRLPLPDEMRGANMGVLVLRPERLQLLSSPEAGLNCVAATVRDIVYHGDSVGVHVALADGAEVVARRSGHRRALEDVPPVGAQVHLGFHSEDAILVREL